MSKPNGVQPAHRPNADPVSTVLAALEKAGLTPRRSGSAWISKCPAHDDQIASLSVSAGDDGRALIHCHAGCKPEEVIKVLGLEMGDLFPRRCEPSTRTTRYEIRDPEGTLIALHIRRDLPDGRKTFAWTRPDGSKGLGGVRAADLPLYSVERIKAREPGAFVFVTEGEKDADALNAAGFMAVASVTGASNCPSASSLSVLAGADVVLWPDNDTPGTSHMARIAKLLREVANSVGTFEWTAGPPGAGAYDYFAAHKDPVAQLKRGLEDVRPAEVAPLTEDNATPEPSIPTGETTGGAIIGASDATPQAPRVTTQTMKLLALAEGAELFHSPQGEAFADVDVSGHRETLPIRSAGFRRWLSLKYFRAHCNAPSSPSMKSAVDVLDARGNYDGAERTVSVRIAAEGDKIYIDLVNSAWEVIEVTPHGWEVVSTPPIRFRRARGMAELRCPTRGGSIDPLRQFLGLVSDDDWILIVSWLLAALRPTGPYPLLVLQGEHGSGKSTVARALRSVLDPSFVPLRSEPRNVQDLMIAASNSWLQAFDNLSHVSDWLSDSFCRLATGGGFGTRELYSNDEEVLFNPQRPMLLNGIHEPVVRSDLLDRTIIVPLPKMTDSRRRTEAELWKDFDAVQPSVLGALLDALSVAMRVFPGIRLRTLPRMADFAVWAAAATPGLKWEPSDFARAYAGNREAAHEVALDSSPVSGAIRDLVAAQGQWEGTSNDLLGQFTQSLTALEAKRLGWPTNARVLSSLLHRLAPDMRACGIDITFRRSHGGARLIALREVERECVSSVTTRAAQMDALDIEAAGATASNV